MNVRENFKEERMKNGILVDNKIWDETVKLANSLGISDL